MASPTAERRRARASAWAVASRPWCPEPARLKLLADDPEIDKFYREAKESIRRFGLPTSKVTDMGDYLVAIRLQRTVLQRWKKDMPWAKGGQVTIANAGQVAAEAGLFPSEGFQPQPSAPPQPSSAPSPTGR